MAKVTMPQLGESVAEGTIGKWLKKPGDAVAKYEPLLEVITDKVNAEVPSPFAGILREILVEEGATVPNNAEIAVIETADEGATAVSTPAAPGAPVEAAGTSLEAQTSATTQEAPAAAAAEATAPVAPDRPAAPSGPSGGDSVEPSTPAAGSTTATGPAGSDERGPQEMPQRAAASAVGAAPTAAAPAGPAGGTGAGAGTADAEGEARMTPAVRRLLREHGLVASQIVGTGGGGRITREDVTNYVEAIRTGQPVNGQIPTAAGRAQTAGACVGPGRRVGRFLGRAGPGPGPALGPGLGPSARVGPSPDARPGPLRQRAVSPASR